MMMLSGIPIQEAHITHLFYIVCSDYYRWLSPIAISLFVLYIYAVYDHIIIDYWSIDQFTNMVSSIKM